MPERFLGLKQAQQDGALVALQQVESTQRQAVLDEWDVRCRNRSIRNPAGYLFGIIQRAIRGEFNAWAAKIESQPPPMPAPPATLLPQQKAVSDIGKQHLAQIRKFLDEG